MKVNSRIAGVLAAMALLTGCGLPYEAIALHREIKGYSGSDLPPEEVATIRLMPPLLLVGIDETERPKPRLAPIVKLLPGMHIIKIGCTAGYRLEESHQLGDSDKLVTFSLPLLQVTTTGGYRVIDVNVEAGHTYEIESEFRRNADGEHYTWMTPVFDDRYAEQIKATVYDGMLTLGTSRDPRRAYKRE
jgi:hypothetical protein